MDSLNIGVKLDAGNAAAGLDKIGASVDNVSSKTKLFTATSNENLAASVKEEAARQKFIKSLENQANQIGKTKSELAAMKAEQLGVTQSVQASIDTLKKYETDQIKKAGQHMEEFGFQTAGAKRELLVLGHELSQGRYKNFAGSLLVLGERTNAMGSVFAMATNPIALAGAALAAFGVVAAEGAMEVGALQKSMQLTGGYAGITVAGFDSMAASIARVSDGRIGSAREALQELVSTGRFGVDELQAMGVAAVNMERLTGQSAAEIVKDFEKMADGVAKWVAEHNKSMHFATAAQYEHIKAMEEGGNKEGAIAETMKLVNGQIDVQSSKLGILEKGWKAVGKGISGFWDDLKSVGRNDPSEVLQSALNYEKTQFTLSQSKGDKGAMNAHNAKMTALQKEIEAINEVAEAKHRADKVQEEGIAAHDSLDKWRQMAGTVNLAKKEVEQFHTEVTKALLSDKNDPKALDAQKNAAKIEAAIRKKYDKSDYKAENKLTTAFTSSYDSMGADNAKMQDEIRQIAEYGKTVDKSRVAVLEFELAKGKLKGLDSTRAGQLRDMAVTGDAEAEKLTGAKGIAELDKKLAAIKAEAEAQLNVKEATKEALLMADLDQQKSRISAEAYALEAAKIHDVIMEMQAKDGMSAGIKGLDAFDKKMAALQMEADAQKGVKEATLEALLLSELGKTMARTDAGVYDEKAAAIHAVTQEIEKNNAAAAIATLNRTTDDQVAKIKAEADSVSQSALEHQKLAAALQIQAKANADIAKSPSQEKSIQAAAADDIKKVGDAYDYADAKRRSFSEGWKKDTTDYLSSISDGAAHSKKIFGDMFKGMEDSLFSFVTTGKLNFSSLAKSIIDDLIRISIQKGITGPLAGSSAVGGMGGWLGSLIGGGGGASVGNGASPSTGGIGFTDAMNNAMAGGWVPQLATGTNYVPQDMLAMIHKGEAVVPAAYNVPDANTNTDSSGHTVNVTVNHNGDSSGTGAANVQQFGAMVGLQIRQTLLQEKRPGGLLA